MHQGLIGVPSGGGGGNSIKPFGTKAGYYYGPQGTDNTLALVTNRLYLVPLLVDKEETFDQISLEVTLAGSAGALLRLGLYAITDGIATGPPLFDTGAVVDGTTTGIKTVAISQSVTPQYVAMAVVGQVAGPPQVRSKITQTDIRYFFTSQANSNSGGWTLDAVSGALPDLTALTLAVGGQAPKLHLRAA